jgi:hypothetical protein
MSGLYTNNVDNPIADAKKERTIGMARTICGEEELMES